MLAALIEGGAESAAHWMANGGAASLRSWGVPERRRPAQWCGFDSRGASCFPARAGAQPPRRPLPVRPCGHPAGRAAGPAVRATICCGSGSRSFPGPDDLGAVVVHGHTPSGGAGRQAEPDRHRHGRGTRRQADLRGAGRRPGRDSSPPEPGRDLPAPLATCACKPRLLERYGTVHGQHDARSRLDLCTPIPPPDLVAAVHRLARGSVLVVGDVMLDRYVYGTVERISPEAPVPIVRVEREVAMPGGAGNVVRNLTALGRGGRLRVRGRRRPGRVRPDRPGRRPARRRAVAAGAGRAGHHGEDPLLRERPATAAGGPGGHGRRSTRSSPSGCCGSRGTR